MPAPSAPRLVLASSSPRRRDLLREHGFVFEIITTQVAELEDQRLGPVRLVSENACLKARPVALQVPDHVVIGSDTVVALEERILGKPSSMEEAAQMLADLNGQTHTVHSGVCIVHAASGQETVFVETTEVRFHTLSPRELALYHRRINPLDKAGAYAAQEDNGQLIAETKGSLSNVIGLPMETLTKRLRTFGILPQP